jgi:hypothetical protein
MQERLRLGDPFGRLRRFFLAEECADPRMRDDGVLAEMKIGFRNQERLGGARRVHALGLVAYAELGAGKRLHRDLQLVPTSTGDERAVLDLDVDGHRRGGVAADDDARGTETE